MHASSHYMTRKGNLAAVVAGALLLVGALLYAVASEQVFIAIPFAAVGLAFLVAGLTWPRRRY